MDSSLIHDDNGSSEDEQKGIRPIQKITLGDFSFIFLFSEVILAYYTLIPGSSIPGDETYKSRVSTQKGLSR